MTHFLKGLDLTTDCALAVPAVGVKGWKGMRRESSVQAPSIQWNIRADV